MPSVEERLRYWRDRAIEAETALAAERAGRGAVIEKAAFILRDHFSYHYHVPMNCILSLDPDATAALAAHDKALVERIKALEVGLREYKDDLCEGFCSDVPRGYCDKTMLNDCGGCRARNLLNEVKP